MDINEYITRMKNINHASKMLNRQRRDLISQFMMSVDIFPGDVVSITAGYKDRIASDRYLVHGVNISFCGNYLTLDIESVDGTYYTHQVPIEKLKDKVELLKRGEQTYAYRKTKGDNPQLLPDSPR